MGVSVADLAKPTPPFFSSLSRLLNKQSEHLSNLIQTSSLLRLPKMPEAKSFTGDRTLGCSIDWDTYAYQNKMREKQRQAALNNATLNNAPDPAEAEALRAKRKRNTEAWSAKHEQEDVRLARREKKQRKREAESKEKMTEEEKARDMDLAQMLAEIKKQNQAKYSSNKDADAQAGAADGVDADDFEGFD